ncbi:MAG: SUMF1/EgtB/PvdO family nonheme iron enzyme, partial [Planctomycetes bacterium]|nr:SUMF1/EgtB/PvdO family nonheme iron enzyme [Planctomycetota bacterium]
PWFAMELVEGTALNRFCDAEKLALPARIALFQEICAGVQHAHQKGVIHRDLKPGNILVSRKDDRFAPKVIDFGIARATDRDLGDRTIHTERGALVGTPEYMSPEQADGDSRRIDTRTDIYALGVILYELLTGRLPFDSAELRAAGSAEIRRVLNEVEPPRPSTRVTAAGAAAEVAAAERRCSTGELQRRLRGDLDWIVLKAMAKEPERRYESAHELAMDLERHLRQQPVLAGPPTASYRLRKFARRHRGQVVAAAAVFLTAMVGTAVALQFALARDAKAREFDLLAGVVQHDQVLAAEQDLYPAWPPLIPLMQRWLERDCGALLARRDEIERQIAGMRARALPETTDELRRQREAHPRFAEWQQLGQHLESLRRAQAIRDGERELVVPPLSPEQESLTMLELSDLVWERIAPPNQGRRVYGEEDVALACARVVVERAAGTEHATYSLSLLAQALLANGQDESGRQRIAEAEAAAVAAGDAESGRSFRQYFDRAVASLASTTQQVEEQYLALSADVMRRSYRFPEQSGAELFLHDTLVSLLEDLDRLVAHEQANVKARLQWAQWLRDGLTRQHPNARHSWDEVRAAIAASSCYAGQDIELRDEDVHGLVPIGMNPVTRLWEFYELRSAWNGRTDPWQLPIPEHAADGSIAVTAKTGIVFVLLPGGTFTMGSQADDEGGPNYDAEALPQMGPVHEVTLQPFLLARHELTQGQWARLWPEADEMRFPSQIKAGMEVNGRVISFAHPVENIDWLTCRRLLLHGGMALPTEAQWEYGCRAGTSTPWWPGDDPLDLAGIANVRDRYACRIEKAWAEYGEPAPFEDGHVGHAPVGSFAANAFGLFDVHGNVWEFCEDLEGSYLDDVKAGDGLRLRGDGTGSRINRGGCMFNNVLEAKCAWRGANTESVQTGLLGVRPARPLRLRD